MPGDLNLKKSWNPALVKNQKKVWEKEQEALKELQTIKQRSKEIAQEREKEHMIRLQYGNNTENLPSDKKLQLNKMGWMYEHKKSDNNQDSEKDEDFLLRLNEVESLLRGNAAAVKPKQLSRFDQITKKPAQKAAKSSVLDDDPLLAIKKSRSAIQKPASRERHTDKHRHRHREAHGSRPKNGSNRSEKLSSSWRYTIIVYSPML